MDYGYYVTRFGGTVIPASDFEKLWHEADGVLRGLLYPADPGRYPEEKAELYRRALCHQAEHLFTAAEDSRGIKSERLGEYSVQYQDSAVTGGLSQTGCPLSPLAVNLLTGGGLLLRWV